jgi:hypothetical protein
VCTYQVPTNSQQTDVMNSRIEFMVRFFMLKFSSILYSMKFRTMKNSFSPIVFRLVMGTACSIGFVALPSIAQAAVIKPSSFSATLNVGETTFVDKTITLDPTGASKVDVLFLADNTGSMGSVINNVKNVSNSLLSSLETKFLDIDFGVARYFGDPSESGVTGGSAYDLLSSITSNNATVTSAINNWIASGGGDFPEANLYALQQVAQSGAKTPSGVGSGESTGWRTGSKKVVVWFGDAPGHQDTISLSDTIAALTGEKVTVAAFNSTSLRLGIDGDDTSSSVHQASSIVAATGGVLKNNFTSLLLSQVEDAIKDAIGVSTSTIDLDFMVTGDTSGVKVGFTCTDLKGCTGVGGGETRSFRVSFEGTAPGTYNFETGFVGVAATETDLITVKDGVTPVPTPALLPGLIGIGVAALRKRRGEATAE